MITAITAGVDCRTARDFARRYASTGLIAAREARLVPRATSG